MSLPEKWTAAQIARTMLHQQFARKMLILVPNTSWPGSECDMLCVTPDLRIVEVEIKVSRSDLLRDREKDKWFHRWDFKKDGPMYNADGTKNPCRRRDWPEKVWKHYYAVPAEVWHSGGEGNRITDKIPHTSGVLVLDTVQGRRQVSEVRKATPCRNADRLSAADAVDIARLAGLRMWDALARLEGCEVRAKKFEEARHAEGSGRWMDMTLKFKQIRMRTFHAKSFSWSAQHNGKTYLIERGLQFWHLRIDGVHVKCCGEAIGSPLVHQQEEILDFCNQHAGLK